MATLLRKAAVEPEPFEARRLSEQMLKEADLVLAMTRAQRGLVVELWPPAVRRAFTLREFAHLVNRVDPAALPAGPPAERLRAAVPLATAERGRQRTAHEDDDIVDPFRLSRAAYAKSFAQIASAVDAVVYAIVIAQISNSPYV
jgi:protein-tyrosine phosphatase